METEKEENKTEWLIEMITWFSLAALIFALA